jgi:hypothetical protein
LKYQAPLAAKRPEKECLKYELTIKIVTVIFSFVKGLAILIILFIGYQWHDSCNISFG